MIDTAHGFYMPSSFTTPIAAHILKTTPESLMSLARTGAIRPEPSGSLLRFSRAEIERIQGRPLTLADWLAAEQAHEPRREIHRRSNARRRARAGAAR